MLAEFLANFGVDLPALIKASQGWVDTRLVVRSNMYQVVGIVVLLLLSKGISRPINRRLNKNQEKWESHWYSQIINGISSILHPMITIVFLWVALAVTEHFKVPNQLLSIASNLMGVWIVIRFSSSFVRNRKLARWIAIAAWSLAALNVLGWLEPTMTQLDALAINYGKSKISLLGVIKGVLSLVGVLWLAGALSRFADRRIHGMTALTPSLRVLMAKFTRTMLIIIAFVVALNSLGLDLTSLAVFSGAVGVGIGFGLQKVVSNFISGIILLLDRSIKPGDVIALNDTYGWVNSLGARCVSVITRDGKEHLIPNELLITERVENWSYSDKNVRLKIQVGVSYQSDVRRALELMLDVARNSPRVLKYPAPNALMREFGDSSVNLELRAWIDDPSNGVSNISSEMMLSIWDSFHENGIQFPFPQRDIYIKPGSALDFLEKKNEAAKDA